MVNKPEHNGDFVKAFISDKNAQNIDRNLEKKINRKEGEGIFVYNFKTLKPIYMKGFEYYLGVKDESLNVLALQDFYENTFKEFTNEYYDRALMFLYNQNQNLTTFSSKMIVKIKAYKFPILTKIEVFKTDENGNLLEIIGRSFPVEQLKTTELVQYSFNGEFDKKLLYKMNHELDFKHCVSEKMISIIEGIEKNKELTTIARGIGYSVGLIKETITNFKTKFDLKNNVEIIEFAKKNYLIPNQFK